MNKLIKIIIFSTYFLSFCCNKLEANENDVVFDSLVVVLKKYLVDTEDKDGFIKKVEQFKITGNRYKQFVAKLTDSIHTDFYLTLAALDNENQDWFEEQPIDFLEKGLNAAITKNDSVFSYEAIILACFKEITVEIGTQKVDSVKTYLDEIYTNLNNIKSNSERIDIIDIVKHDAQHNLGIIERLLGNYKKAEEILKPLTIDSNLIGVCARRVEKATNSMNELGRVYLTKGVLNNDDSLIEQSINVFDKAINILKDEGCSPYHLEELYQRKQKALFLIGRDREALDLVNKLNSFTKKRCIINIRVEQQSIRWLLFQSIVYDFPNIELVEDTETSIKQKDILVEQKERLTKQNRNKNWLLTLLITSLCLLAFFASNWLNKRNELNKKKNELTASNQGLSKVNNLLKTRNYKLNEAINKIKVLQLNASKILEVLKENNIDKDLGSLQKKHTFLDEYLPEIFKELKSIRQIEGDSNLTAILFERDKKMAIYKIIKEEIKDYSHKHKELDRKSLYFSYYTGILTNTFVENNFQKNYKNLNENIDRAYLDNRNITCESIICAPLVFNTNEKPLGIIALRNDKIERFNDEDTKLIQAIANMLTPIVANIEIEAQKDKFKFDRNLMIKTVNHRFKNYYNINKAATQRIEKNIEDWDKEKLKTKLVDFVSDFKIHEGMFNSFKIWMEFLESEQNSKSASYSIFNLKETVSKVIDNLAYPLKEHAIETNIRCDDNIFIKNMPDVYIREIFFNLIVNFINHVKEIQKNYFKPEIKINVSKDNASNNLLISIIDNGEGIPEAIAPNLFQSAYTNSYEKKDGFGNRIIKYIINKISGSIKIDTNYSEGTKIDISINKEYIKI